MKTFIFLMVFLLIGAFFIISNENIKLNSSQNISLFFSEYGKWIDQLVNNSKSLAGYIVKSEWLPDKGKFNKE